MRKELILSYEELQSIDELNPAFHELLEKAKEATHKSYAPFSGFYVGAALLAKSGKIFTASNQENASFPACVCAETNVLGALTAHDSDDAPVAIAVTVRLDDESTNTPLAPCGVCRQQLMQYEERFNQPISVILQGSEGPILVFDGMKNLLPFNLSSDEVL